jgi:hypothetical protein
VLHCGQGGEGRLVIEGVEPSNSLLVYYLDRSHPDVSSVPVLDDALREDPIQVMFGGGIEAMARLHVRLAEELGAQVQIHRTKYPASGVLFLDVLRAGVGKAEALAFLQRRWEVTARETLAIGDNWNDHEMLEAAGLGLVMGNADPEMLRQGLAVLAAPRRTFAERRDAGLLRGDARAPSNKESESSRPRSGVAHTQRNPCSDTRPASGDCARRPRTKAAPRPPASPCPARERPYCWSRGPRGRPR